MNKILFFILFVIFNIYLVFGNNLNIPNIEIEVQSGLEEVGDDIYECKKEDCKVNLSIEDIFVGDYKKSNYDCLWDFGYGTFKTSNTDKKCNPGYVNYGTGEHNIGVKVLEKNNYSNFKEKLFKILNGVELNYGYGEKDDDSDLDYGYGDSPLNEDEIIIPDIFFDFQRPSYITNLDNSLDNFICDNSKDECKINFDLRDSFSGSIKEKDFSCEINFGSGNITGEENKCNPNTVIFPKGNFEIKFKITSKQNNDFYKEKIIFLENIDETDEEYNNGNNEEKEEKKEEEDEEEKQNIVINDIIVQSGLKLDENGKYFCNKEICSVNLIYENDNPKILCEWNFGEGFFTTQNTDRKCNPGYVKYYKGEHDISLKIYDKNYENNFKKINFNFENIFSDLIPHQEKQETIEENIENNLFIFDFKKLENISILNVLANPEGVDHLEYIELINDSNKTINLKGCKLDDVLDGGSKKYIFDEDSFLFPNSKRKFYKSETKLNLNNTGGDEVNFICDDKLIDNLSWNFSVYSGFIINKYNSNIESQKVKILKVIDGDTFLIQFNDGTKERLRLIGVDTPEIKDPRKAVQYFGLEASKFSRELLDGEEVFLEIDKNNFRDKYSRLLGYVYLNGESFNKKIIEKGYARVYDNYPFKYLGEYRKSEIYAKKNKLGMWEKINPDLEKILLDEKYNKEIKNDLKYIKLVENLEEKLDVLREEQKILEEKNEKINDLNNEIDFIFKNYFFNNIDNNLNNIPDDFDFYKKANLLDQNNLVKLLEDINFKEKRLIKKLDKDDIKDFIKNTNKKELLKYKLFDKELFILDKEKSFNNYSLFVQYSNNIKVSKLKSGLKIYGNTLSDSKIKINLSKKNSLGFYNKQKLIELFSDINGYFEYKNTNISDIYSGNYKIDLEITDKFGNSFLINKNKEFELSKEYISELNKKLISDRNKILEKIKKDENQSLSYLDKFLLSLEKIFTKDIKRIEKENNKKTKKSKTNKISKNKEKKLKTEVFDKKENYQNKDVNKNGILYIFLIILFSFSLIFILLKKEKIIYNSL